MQLRLHCNLDRGGREGLRLVGSDEEVMAVLGFVSGTEILGIGVGDIVFVSIWAISSLLLTAIWLYRMFEDPEGR